MPRNLIDPDFDPLTELRQAQLQIAELTEAVIQLQKNQNQLILASGDCLNKIAYLERRIKHYEKNNNTRDQNAA